MNSLAQGCVLAVLLLCRAASAEAPTTLPSEPPRGLDPVLWARMRSVDARAASIRDLAADFQQKKFTPLLNEPMVSDGTVLSKGAVMQWTTRAPEPTIMHVDSREIEIYYPRQQTAEVYPIDSDLSQLAASPLPRLAALLDHFSFSAASAADLGEKDDAHHLALRMTPTEARLGEHVRSVTVLIDADRGFIMAIALVDADAERTEIRFSHVSLNTNLDDSRLLLKLPANVKTVHPLEGLGAAPADAEPARK